MMKAFCGSYRAVSSFLVRCHSTCSRVTRELITHNWPILWQTKMENYVVTFVRLCKVDYPASKRASPYFSIVTNCLTYRTSVDALCLVYCSRTYSFSTSGRSVEFFFFLLVIYFETGKTQFLLGWVLFQGKVSS